VSPNPTRYEDHRDATEPGIVMALLQAGATVERISGRPTAGLPDLAVGFRGKTFLLEVKNPPGPRGGTARSGLNSNQRAFFDRWHGHCAVVRTPAEALEAIGAVKKAK
jgi:hypothetical protein